MSTEQAATEAVISLGQTTIGYWIQTVAYFLAAAGAIGAAFTARVQLEALKNQIKTSEDASAKQVASAEKLSRQRATVEVVRHEQTDKELLEAFKRYAELRDDNGKLVSLAVAHPSEKDDNGLVLRVLNNYEYVSTGILTGAFDEEIYKRMKYTNLIRDWDALKPYVCQLRQKYDKPKLFIEFEAVAEKWRSAPPT